MTRSSFARYWPLWISLLAVVAISLIFVLGASAKPNEQSDPPPSAFHPDFPLLDSAGQNVLASGEPVSTMETCGQCHDTAFIAEHSLHISVGLEQWTGSGNSEGAMPWTLSPGLYGNWDPLSYRYLTPPEDELFDLGTAEWIQTQGIRHVGGGPAMLTPDGALLTELSPQASQTFSHVLDPETGEPVLWVWEESGIVEVNCFLCHTAEPDNAARIAALERGAFEWANTATLLASGVISETEDGFEWSPDAFDEMGNLRQSSIGLQDPENENCGLCHGLTAVEVESPLSFEACLGAGRRTATTGQVISPQRISSSGMNLAGKDQLTRSWDIHAERLVECTDCHYSLNNPVYVDADPESQPEHLTFDPRRLELGEYLHQPIHNFARGASTNSSLDPSTQGTMRPCQSCHDAEGTHTWLPYTQQHMESVSCETCHVPSLYGGGMQQVDWTVYNGGGPQTACRLVQEEQQTPQDILQGYQPVWLFKGSAEGDQKLAPFNLISTWYWIHGDPPRPVRSIDLEAAWMEGSGFAPEVLSAFDNNQDGQLDNRELRLDTDAKETLIATRLMALGLENPRIVGEIQPFSISHSVASDEFAIRECSACHGEESRISQPFELARFVPAGVEPTFVEGTNVVFDQSLVSLEEGKLVYRPATRQSGLYIFGHDAVGWIDLAGALVFVGVLLGVTAHGGLRLLSKEAHTASVTEEVYMYGLYERLWHWLQTFTISALLFTGLIIHKPDIFAIFSFRHVVLVHNVLAGILVVNAFLALFYHLASGEIQQYLPKPVGFFGQAVLQARYYMRGIFKGEPHPFEKRPERKLNPLQQITYIGILNVLLPLQIITGLLMWGVQQWPELSSSLGGLPVLAPIHSLVAWLFASFIVAHVYLTTTAGPRALSAIQAMMLGWEEVEHYDKEQNE